MRHDDDTAIGRDPIGSALTVIESGPGQTLELGYERPPNEPGEWSSRVANAFKALVLVGLVGAYPAVTIRAHQINDAPLEGLSYQSGWTTLDGFAAYAILMRELDGPGWASDKTQWHPQSRLTALPAWQAGLADALADELALKARLAAQDGEADIDLAAASRLLRTRDDADMTSRISAAAEAIARYDGRAARGLAELPKGPRALNTYLRLTERWAATSRAELSALIQSNAGWPAERAAVEGFYIAKARAFVAGEGLAAAERRDSILFDDPELKAAHARALSAWRQAADMQPLFVSNLSSDSLIGGNHLAAMGFRLAEAETASQVFSQALAARLGPSATGGEVADVAMLAVTP